MALPVVLDVDTGVDDACALLLAALHPALDLRAVTCVEGNAPVAAVVANTLTVLDAVGREDVVVARGAAGPLLGGGGGFALSHGGDGLGDLDWPRSTRSADPRQAVAVLHDVLVGAAASPPAQRVTLLCLGPLTNLALLLRTHPEAAAGLREVVFVGGAARWEPVGATEFNVSHDPEAAAAVLDACTDLEVPLTMYGMDVFHEPQVSLDLGRRLASAGGGGAAELAGRLVGFRCDRTGSDTTTIGDAGAVCAVIEPGGVRRERLPVRIELAGAWTRGRTVVGEAEQPASGTGGSHRGRVASVDVCLGVDGRRYATIWSEAVSGGFR
jgi:pyrimidine-specific ribonucleoside hydrolase